jgi:hypothetical protein
MRGSLRKKWGAKVQDSLAMLLKTHGEKMSPFYPTTILMKTNHLKSVSRDVYENKGAYLRAVTSDKLEGPRSEVRCPRSKIRSGE